MSKIKKNSTKVEVTGITAEGCWLRVRTKNYYISFVDRYPHFLGATVKEIEQVTLDRNELHWEALGIDLEIDNFIHPERYPYIGFTNEQLKKVRKAIKTTKVSEWVLRQLERFESVIEDDK